MKTEFLVLVVEDDALTRNVIIDLLRNEGFQTAEADGVRTALEIFAPGKYQVVVLDNKLGDGMGVDLCRQLIKLDPTIRIFLFAGATDEVRLEALAAGAIEVLQKPYDLTKLSFLVKRELRRSTNELEDLTRGAVLN